MEGIIAQLIGFIALIFLVISFQNNNSKGILKYQMIGSFGFTIHFILLGAYTGAFMNLLGLTRNIVFYNRNKKWAGQKLWLYVFIALFIAAGLMTWKNIYSIFPVFAMVISTIGLSIKNPKVIRTLLFPTSPCWLIYNIANVSIAGIMTEIFILASMITAIMRFDVLKLPERQKEA